MSIDPSQGSAERPQLSVVMVVALKYRLARQAIQALLRQSSVDRLELVLVAPSCDQADLDDNELAQFKWLQIVEVGANMALGEAKAAGVRATSAPLVALGEDHVLPTPGWAEALIQASAAGWTGIGSAFDNANPHSLLGWIHLIFAYEQWLTPAQAGEKEDIPGHNSVYRREALLAYGPALGAKLDREGGLHRDLRRQGGRLFLEPTAVVYHYNVTGLWPSTRLRFYGGRLFGATRVKTGHWSLWRRLIYILAAPLIPWIHLRRVLSAIRRTGRQRQLLPAILPGLLYLLVVAAIGEVVGYAFGPGDALMQTEKFEFGRM